MIVDCQNCGDRYEIYETTVQASKCLNCYNRITVRLPQDAFSQNTHTHENLFHPNELVETKTSGIGLIPKVMSLMLIISLLPLIVFAAISIRQNSMQIRKDTELIGSQLTLRLAKQVDEWVKKNVSAIKALAEMPDIQSMEPDKQRPLLKAVQQNNQGMVGVFTTSISGRMVAADTDSAIKAYAQLLDRFTFYRVMIGKQEVMWRTMTEKTSQKRVLITAVPIKRDGKIIGIVANSVTLDYISRQVAVWKRGTSGYAFLVDENGAVIAHQISKYAIQNRNMRYHPLINAFLNGLYHGTIYFDDSNGVTHLGHVRGTRNGWALAMQQSDDEAFALLYKTRRFAFILLSLTVAVVSCIAWLLGQSIVKPIRKLSMAADRISLGDLSLKIDIKSKDEIGQLAKSIGLMQDSILMAITRLRRRSIQSSLKDDDV